MNFYEILKTKKLGRGSPDYWTQLFAEHVGGKGEWKVAGVLPLTFTAKGGTAADWVIYGNDDNGTENLYDKNTYTEMRAWLNSNGEIQVGALDWQVSDYIPIEANENYTISNVVGYSPAYCLYDSNKNYILGNTYANNTKIIFQAPANAAFARFSLKYGSISGADPNIDVFMVTKGSIAPDHYIPYQIGVGERTKNLLKITATTHEIRGVTLTVDNGKVTLTGTATSVIAEYITGEFTNINEDMIISGNPIDAQFSKYHINIIWKDGTNSNYIASQPMRLGDFPEYTSEGIYGLRIIVRSGVQCNDINFKPMIRKANTSPSFEPYGYQIPLTVSQQGQTDKTVDIYIGDSPLTEGETVSKTSTGQDIELFEGENTVSTTLYNKPTMEIKYK